MKQQAASGCALSIVFLLISYGTLDAVVSRTFLESLRNNALYNLALLIPSAIGVWLIFFGWNLFYQPVKWHYEIASDERLLVRRYNAIGNHKKVGVRVDNLSDQKFLDVRVMLKTLTRISVRTGARVVEQINQDNLEFIHGAYFDEQEGIKVRRGMPPVIVHLAEDRNGAPVFLLKEEFTNIPLEKLSERMPIAGGEDIVDEREVALWEIELEIHGLSATGIIPFKDNIIFEKKNWVDLFGAAPQIESGIYMGVNLNAKKETEN